MIVGINGGCLARKKEMTRVMVEGKMLPVTVLLLEPQKVVQHKTVEVDGYSATVIGLGEKQKKIKDKVVSMFRCKREFTSDQVWQSSQSLGFFDLDASLFSGKVVTIIATSKGKGFQGVMKRHNTKGGPETHGSKFHRQVGSMGNRKPRRVQKGHPHAGHMGTDRVMLKGRPIVGAMADGDNLIVLIKGSVPGAYNSLVQVGFEINS